VYQVERVATEDPSGCAKQRELGHEGEHRTVARDELEDRNERRISRRAIYPGEVGACVADENPRPAAKFSPYRSYQIESPVNGQSNPTAATTATSTRATRKDQHDEPVVSARAPERLPSLL
jgi:hypothetical protein